MTAVIREAGLLRACLDLLAAEGIFHRRWNVGAVKNGDRFFRFGVKGDADILAFPRLWFQSESEWLPVPLWIECKRPGGKLTAHQLWFADEVRTLGHHWLEVNDAMQVFKWLRDHRAR